ncbi:MAG: hypothetical protein ACSHWY_01570 [Octadecabacter sp.]
MIWLARALRVALIGVCVYVLSGIVPISLVHFQTGNGCPMIGPVPACYVVSVAYSAMALAGIIWWRVASWVFSLGAIPVILLAVVGTLTELSGIPTCPRSAGGMPLCYASLAVGLGLLVTFLLIRWIEKNRTMPQSLP